MIKPNKPLTYALIDLDAIAHNVRSVRQRLKPNSELFAVVKANGYGHGATAVARTALANGATRLAVARLSEGVELREAGIRAPILVMGYCLPTNAELVLTYELTVTVNTAASAQALSQLATKQGKTASVHVKVDSG
ncbi:MAG: alanine racemase, partial [Methylococcales bacterium]|nr:alanine racemase [Methylococcales bacterium]